MALTILKITGENSTTEILEIFRNQIVQPDKDRNPSLPPMTTNTDWDKQEELKNLQNQGQIKIEEGNSPGKLRKLDSEISVPCPGPILLPEILKINVVKKIIAGARIKNNLNLTIHEKEVKADPGIQ